MNEKATQRVLSDWLPSVILGRLMVRLAQGVNSGSFIGRQIN